MPVVAMPFVLALFVGVCVGGREVVESNVSWLERRFYQVERRCAVVRRRLSLISQVEPDFTAATPELVL